MESSPWTVAPPSSAVEPYRVTTAAPKPLRPRAHTPFRSAELAIAIAIVVAIDLSLWGQQGLGIGGFGLALAFTALPVLLFAAARRWRRSPRLGVIVALLAIVALRTAIHPTVLTTLSGLALLVPFTVALRARRTFVPEAALSMLTLLLMFPSPLLATYAGARSIATRTSLGNVALAPIVVPLALSGLFIGVFALANPILGGWIEQAFDALLAQSFPPVGRVITWGLALLAAIVLLRPVVYLARGTEAATTEDEAAHASVTLARNILVSLNLVFAAYHLLDGAYLWSGHPPDGMTTQHYAHAGALWLTVALAMLTAVVGLVFRGPLAHDARARSVRLLAYAWVAQGLVLAMGTYRRIFIHVEHTGLSNLRIVGILGTTLVVAGVILVAAKLYRRRSFAWIVRRQLDAFALTVVLFAVAPTHWLSAQVNVSRVLSGEQGPLMHLAPQSREVESVASLTPLLDHPDVRVRQGVAALLVEEREHLRGEVAAASSWRQRDVLRTRSLATLDASSARIAAVLEGVDPLVAQGVLLRLAEAAAWDRPAAELDAIPDARAIQSAR